MLVESDFSIFLEFVVIFWAENMRIFCMHLATLSCFSSNPGFFSKMPCVRLLVSQFLNVRTEHTNVGNAENSEAG